MAFEIFEGTDDDVSLMPELFVAGMLKEPQWKILMQDVKVEDWLAFQLAYFKMRWILPDKRLFFAREIATGKVVGFTVLGLPGTFPKEQVDASSGIPPLPEGVNKEVFQSMVTLVGITNKYGYDSTVDYHRKGIVVLPEYQRKGIARMLSQHLNDIVDAEGGKTYAVTVPASMMLFSTQGFEIVATENMDLTKFGGTLSQGSNYVMVRKPNGK